MKVYKVYPQGFAANSYFVTSDGVHAIIIDPAQPRILEEAKRRSLTVEAALLTHGHFDHIGGAHALSEAGVKLGCFEKEREAALHHNLAREFGERVEPFPIDFTFGEEELHLAGLTVKVIATPGHTAGSVSYLIGDSLFTGDTLFQGSVGRTDLPTGNSRALFESLKKLLSLPGDCAVYAGHGEDSTIAYEREYNPYVRR